MLSYINLISVTVDDFIHHIEKIESFYNKSLINNNNYLFNLNKLNNSFELCLSKLNLIKTNLFMFDFSTDMEEYVNDFNTYFNRLFINFKKLKEVISQYDYYLLIKSLNNDSIFYIFDYLDFTIEIFVDFLDSIIKNTHIINEFINEVDYRVDEFNLEVYQYLKLNKS